MQVQGMPGDVNRASPRLDAGRLTRTVQAEVIPLRLGQHGVIGQADAVAGTAGVQLYRVVEAMKILGLSRSMIYRQFKSGRLRSVHQGRTRLIPAAAIAEYVALLESEAGR